MADSHPSSAENERRPRSDAGACLDLEALERALRLDPSGSPARHHLSACSTCRARLDAMRRDQVFLDRFAGVEEAPRVGSDALRHEFPGYEIESLLDFGGQGAVYRARDLATGQPVAIKVPFGDAIRSPAKRYRFRREVELTARLDHPGIVPIRGTCEGRSDRLGCVMDVVEGEPFDDWSSKRLSTTEGRRAIVAVVSSIAEAIAYAHQRAVLHRDLKPSNVIVTEDDQPRVLDFGLAKALDDEAGSFATVTGAFVGTLACAAPEQVGGSSDGPDVRTDVYGLGMLLYVGLAGRSPWPTSGDLSVLAQAIRETDPPRPTSIGGLRDSELDAIAHKALAKEKNRRYASAAALAADLRRWLADEPIEARFDSRWYIFRKRAHRHRRAIAIGAVIAIGCGVVASLALSARSARQQATFAAAVRDARAIDSHLMAIDRARSLARDNVASGEVLLWNAFLDPDPAVVAVGIEGAAALTEVPTSPAYWGLWEVMLRTPIVASIELAFAPWVAFATPDVVAGWDGESIVWWDWRREKVVRREKLANQPAYVRCGAGWLLMGAPDATTRFFDLAANRWTDLGPGRAKLFDVRTDRLAIVRAGAPGAWEVEFTSRSEAGLEIISSCMLAWEPSAAALDEAGELLVFRSVAGDLCGIDASSGALRFARSEFEGRPVEWLIPMTGGWGIALLNIGVPLRLDVSTDPPQLAAWPYAAPPPRTQFPRSGVARVDERRYAGLTDRGQLITGERSDPLTSLRVHPEVVSHLVGVSPDERFIVLALAPRDRTTIFDRDATAVRRLPQPTTIVDAERATVFDLHFEPDGRSVVAAAMDGSLRRHAVDSDSVEVLLAPGTADGIARIAAVEDGFLLGLHDVGRSDVPLRRVDRKGVSATPLLGERWICGITREPQVATWVLMGDGRLVRLDAEARVIERERQLPSHRMVPGFRALARHPTRRLLLVGPCDAGIALLDEETLESVRPSVPMSPVHDIAVSPTDPDLFATAHADGTVRLWRLADRAGPNGPSTLACEAVRELSMHAGSVLRLAFHPAGRILASGGGAPESRALRLWDVETGRELAALELFARGIFCLAFSPDGRWLAAGGESDPLHAAEGGQLFLIDLDAPARMLAGSLRYHRSRLAAEQGRSPVLFEAVRDWLEAISTNSADRTRDRPLHD